MIGYMKHATPFDARQLDIATRIFLHGYTNISVGSGECAAPGCRGCSGADQPWSYTIGMVDHGLPELVTTGLANTHVIDLTSMVWGRYKAGRAMTIDDVGSLGPVSVRLDSVPVHWLTHDLSRISLWLDHYGPGRNQIQAPSLAQVVWSDADGRFPDHPRCCPDVVAAQPLLSSDWLRYPRRQPRRNRRQRTRRSW